jgi:cation transport protein ChaC
MLAVAPRPDRVWVFGFGSLIWNPAFHHVERRTALIRGYHRQFCLLSKAGRGSPQNPGLMLALERGGSCHGVAYRIAPEHVESELDVVWRREMLTGAYRAKWVSAQTPDGVEHAIAFAANHTHERYVRGLDTDETARLLATGAGPLGSCCDYLFDTVSHLEALGIRDKRMESLVERVRACMASATPPELSD